MTTNSDQGNSDVQDTLTAREQSVIAREIVAKDLARKLKEKEDTLQEREADLKIQDEKITLVNAELSKRKTSVAAAEVDIANRARVVSDREIQADAGFAAQNREALAQLTNQHAALRTESGRVQAELDFTRLEGIEKLDAWLATERATRIASLDADLQAERTRHKATLHAEREAQDAAFAEQQSHLAKNQRALAEARDKLDDKELELSRKTREVQCRQEAQ